jgi:hypothetical protein
MNEITADTKTPNEYIKITADSITPNEIINFFEL